MAGTFRRVNGDDSRGHLARVLIVDDHPGTQRSLQLLLRSLDHESDTANDGREALEAVRAGHYELILMDVLMPVMDGLEATRRIRELWPIGSGLRIVGMSAETLPEDQEVCFSVGMEEFLPKPIDIEALVRILREMGSHLLTAC